MQKIIYIVFIIVTFAVGVSLGYYSHGHVNSVNLVNLDQNKYSITQEELNEAFINAVSVGKIQQVKNMMNKNIDINYQETDTEETALMKAAKNGDLKTFEYLLSNKANLKIHDTYGNSVLSIAAKYGQLQIVEILISKDENIDHANIYGRTPLMMACQSAKNEIDQYKVVEYLLSKEAEINQKDRNGDTPLLDAIQAGNYNIVKLLLDKGADIHLKDDKGRSAIDIAEELENTKIMKLLKEAIVETETAAASDVN